MHRGTVVVFVRALAIASGAAIAFGIVHLVVTIVLLADQGFDALDAMPLYLPWTAAAAASLLLAIIFSPYIVITRLPPRKRIPWTLGLLYLGPVSLPVFWVLHVRPLLSTAT